MAESLKYLDLRTEVEITEKSRWHVSTEVNGNIKDVTEDLEIKESETNTPLWYSSGADTCVPQPACYKNNAEKAFWKVLSEQHPHFSCKIVFAIMDNKERTTKCLKYMILCAAVLWTAVLTPQVFWWSKYFVVIFYFLKPVVSFNEIQLTRDDSHLDSDSCT